MAIQVTQHKELFWQLDKLQTHTAGLYYSELLTLVLQSENKSSDHKRSVLKKLKSRLAEDSTKAQEILNLIERIQDIL